MEKWILYGAILMYSIVIAVLVYFYIKLQYEYNKICFDNVQLMIKYEKARMKLKIGVEE